LVAHDGGGCVLAAARLVDSFRGQQAARSRECLTTLCLQLQLQQHYLRKGMVCLHRSYSTIFQFLENQYQSSPSRKTVAPQPSSVAVPALAPDDWVV
jgi:hypothetical protein